MHTQNLTLMRSPVAVTIAALLAIVIVLILAMMILSHGHRGILVRSVAGRFIADTNAHSELLQRNLQAVGFRKCDYFTGLSVFTTLEGNSCPWYMSDELAIANVRARTD